MEPKNLTIYYLKIDKKKREIELKIIRDKTTSMDTIQRIANNICNMKVVSNCTNCYSLDLNEYICIYKLKRFRIKRYENIMTKLQSIIKIATKLKGTYVINKISTKGGLIIKMSIYNGYKTINM